MGTQDIQGYTILTNILESLYGDCHELVARKRHKIWQALRLPSVPFPWSLAVHHQSLVSPSPLPCEKRSAWGGGWSSCMKAENPVVKTPSFWNRFFHCFLSVDPTHLRIPACRRLTRDIFEFSDVCGFISPGFVLWRGLSFMYPNSDSRNTLRWSISPINGASKDVSRFLVLLIFLPNVNIADSSNTHNLWVKKLKGSLEMTA